MDQQTAKNTNILNLCGHYQDRDLRLNITIINQYISSYGLFKHYTVYKKGGGGDKWVQMVNPVTCIFSILEST